MKLKDKQCPLRFRSRCADDPAPMPAAQRKADLDPLINGRPRRWFGGISNRDTTGFAKERQPPAPG